MKLSAVSTYTLEINNDFSYTLKQDNKKCSFNDIATLRKTSKLYTVSQGKALFYVGMTTQTMSSRLRQGLKAKKYFYKWKYIREALSLQVWSIKDHNNNFLTTNDMEAIEAEVAYCCRHVSGQWPQYQHEIHFQQSKKPHIKVAEEIYRQITTSS